MKRRRAGALGRRRVAARGGGVHRHDRRSVRTRRLASAVLASGLILVAAGCGDGEGGSAAGAEAVQPSSTDRQPVGTGTEPVPTTTEPEPEPTETGTSAERLVVITVVGGRPQGGIARVTVDREERVRLRVRSDVDDEVHLHGYDVEWDVGPGRARAVVVEATVPGRFELELHETGTQIGELTVEP